MKFLKMVHGFAFRDIARRAVLALELIVGLLILFYFTDRLVVLRQAEKYAEACYGAAVFDKNDYEAVEFAKAEGRLTGSIVALQVKFDEEKKPFTVHILFGGEAFYENIPLDLKSGERFKTEAAADYSCIVPYSLRNKYKCGSIYELEVYDLGRIRVFISGVLNTDNTFVPENAGFADDNLTIYAVCSADDPVLDMDNNEHGTAVIENADAEACMKAGVTTAGMTAASMKQFDLHTLAPLLFFAVALIVIFTCGYIGEQYLSLAEKEKTLAVYFLCGASRGVSFAAMFSADVIWLIAPFAAAAITALIIGIRLWPGGMLIPLAYLAVGTGVVSFLLLRSTAKKSITETIRKRWYS